MIVKQSRLIQKIESLRKVILFSSFIMWISNVSTYNAYAQGNNFFGTTPSEPSAGGAGYSSQDQTDDSNANAVLPGLNSTNPNTNPPAGTDFSGDEKRMQKKYKANLNSAKKLIDKGDQMMSSAKKNVNDPDYKKGKILKETGEKWLTQLKTNNPFAAEQKNK